MRQQELVVQGLESVGPHLARARDGFGELQTTVQQKMKHWWEALLAQLNALADNAGPVVKRNMIKMQVTLS
jgi:hypothetical protein